MPYSSLESLHLMAYVLRLATVLVLLAGVRSIFAVTPFPLAEQRHGDSTEPLEAAHHLARGEGYLVTEDGQATRGFYPPLFAVALAPFDYLAPYPEGEFLGAKVYASMYLVVAALVAWQLGGPLAALLTALAVSLSPFARSEVKIVLTDAFSAALIVAIAGLLSAPGRGRIVVASALAGVLPLIRYQLILVAVSIWWTVRKSFRRAAIVAAIPGVIAVLAFNAWAYGGPSRTGYEPMFFGADRHFAWWYPFEPSTVGRAEGGWTTEDVLHGGLLRWLCTCPPYGPQVGLPNIVYYPALLLGLLWVFNPPLVSGIGMIAVWRQRQTPFGRFTISLTALLFTLFTFYFSQATRLFAGPITLLIIAASVGAASLAARVSPTLGPVRGARDDVDAKPIVL